MKYTPKVHITPLPMKCDAYTIGGNLFQSEKAKEKSGYYGVFRKALSKIDPFLYDEGDERMIFIGIQRILHRLFYKPLEQWEISETVSALQYARATPTGLRPYWFPKELWQICIDKYNGRIPIIIKAMPEGSVVYRNEPTFKVHSLVEDFGEFAAMFESKLLQVWASSERITQDMHMYDKIRKKIRKVNPNLSKEEVNFIASIMITDFGDRAGMCEQESEEQGLAGLYAFPGTDTFCAGYQAWKNSNHTPGVFSSVYALAHRNIQAFDNENEAYMSLYNAMDNDSFGSMVNDCYSSRNAVEKYHVPLALQAHRDKNGKIIVTRPDSGIAKDEVLWTVGIAVKNNLFETVIINGIEWKVGTNLKFIEGDGLTNKDILDIMDALIELNYVFYAWGLFGQGGGKRNSLKRDNLSAKFALWSIGNDDQPVVKFSDTFGKTTIPGPCKVLRSKEALESKKTVVFEHEPGEDAMVVYYNGLAEEDFFDGGMLDDFNVIKARMHEQFDSMPLTMTTEKNHGYSISDKVTEIRRALLNKYAPNKEASDY